MNKERAALVHGYLNDREGKDRPDRLTRLGILAAAELYRHGQIDKICFTTEESFSSNQVKRIKKLLNNPPEADIIVYPEAITTKKEIKTFKKISEEKGWKNLLTIGNESHIARIKKDIKATFKNKAVETTTPREVLADYPRYCSILKEMNGWPEQYSLTFQEKILNTPLIGTLALKSVPLVLKYKLTLQSRFFEQLEKKLIENNPQN